MNRLWRPGESASLHKTPLRAQLKLNGSSIIIIDSSLNPTYQIGERQLLALSGSHGRGTDKGGSFTQALVNSIGADDKFLLQETFLSVIKTTHMFEVDENPVLMVSALSPVCRSESSKILCRVEKRQELR